MISTMRRRTRTRILPLSPLPLIVVLGLLSALAACAKEEAKPPPERITYVTSAKAVKRDLPIVESAVGAQTAVGLALAYDPTRVTPGTVYVRLPFPEHVAERLRIGQAVTLSSFLEPERRVHGRILEIRPALNITTLTREVIVAVREPGWQPTGSIRGEVVLGVRRGALVVPEQAVVLRPSGTVVYVVEGEIVRERAVKTGLVREGVIEIVEGLRPEETVVVEGAALLSDKAKIKAREGGA